MNPLNNYRVNYCKLSTLIVYRKGPRMLHCETETEQSVTHLALVGDHRSSPSSGNPLS